ncbi:hypothetical protein ACFU7Y_38665 [Kitasatospora sp. NPDC057542]|uniref:hypothetical protein n=1 Tax=Kitasatospora sp. NPDC057542 TaxID=3346162 RepID=UPI0036B1B3CF
MGADPPLATDLRRSGLGLLVVPGLFGGLIELLLTAALFVAQVLDVLGEPGQGEVFLVGAELVAGTDVSRTGRRALGRASEAVSRAVASP